MGSGPGGSQAGGQNARHSHARTGRVLFSSRPAGGTGQARTAPAHGFKCSTDSNHSASGSVHAPPPPRASSYLPASRLVTPGHSTAQLSAEKDFSDHSASGNRSRKRTTSRRASAPRVRASSAATPSNTVFNAAATTSDGDTPRSAANARSRAITGTGNRTVSGGKARTATPDGPLRGRPWGRLVGMAGTLPHRAGCYWQREPKNIARKEAYA